MSLAPLGQSRIIGAMKTTLSLSSLGLALLVMTPFLSVACGSEVTQGNATSSGSSSTTSSSGSSGSGDPVQDCADACHKYETLNCNLPGGSDCNTMCAEQVAGFPTECAAEVATYFECLVQNTTSCEFPTVCDAPQMALETCQLTYGCDPTSTCFGGGGMGGEMSCGCDETCKGIKYSTNCTTPAGATMTTCDCLVSDKSVGMCQQTAAGACGAQDSCCNAMYFKL